MPGKRRIQREGNLTWQAHLAAMRMTAEEQTEIGMRRLTVDLRSM